MLSIFNKLLFWNYPRSSVQWDILCVVILIFIFLTPKSWFESGERRVALAHQNPTASTLVVSAEVVEKAQDRRQLEEKLRAFTGRRDLQVLDVHKLADGTGKTTGYKIDIR
ncbi:MAG TPA: hypothetical protein VJT50_04110 [Pyrinomonadaceae bacterium]|nr:hypothetical protein [Pyrinomonadaceae bacterium]